MVKVPLSTYRVQVSPDFDFDQTAAIVDYLAELGISHLYASPYLQAVPGSSHGYNIVDPTKVNREIGGSQGHLRLCQTLQDKGLSQILDIVPNHMDISNPENIWWWDVLENGFSSLYLDFFDLYRDISEQQDDKKILLPILGNHYGQAIKAGDIGLRYDEGFLRVQYLDNALPVDLRSLVPLLNQVSERLKTDELFFLVEAIRNLLLPVREKDSRKVRHRNKEVIKYKLFILFQKYPEIVSALEEIVNNINKNFNLLDNFLEQQNYRLVYWRTAASNTSYRRFFDINNMIGLRQEEEEVFEATHILVLNWLKTGLLDGLRIDHPDGLSDPEEYFNRLRKASPHAWIVAEKILHFEETIPSTWPVQGTTGYDFMNLVLGLFINPEAKWSLTEIYKKFTGQVVDYSDLVRLKKHQVMEELFSGDIGHLTGLFRQICLSHPFYKDYQPDEIDQVLRELIACFTVYRIYIRIKHLSLRTEEQKMLNKAVQTAKLNRPGLSPELFDLVCSLLSGSVSSKTEKEFIMRFQQITPAITAKGIEDTAFYCYNRFVALNEVGGEPSRFGNSLQTFHQTVSQTARLRPYTMLSTSTHDSKRSEDVRARLAVLSEIPDKWSEMVFYWTETNQQYKKESLPDSNTEYLLYQTLVGAWPIDKDRLKQYLEKAVREAKVYTSWIDPDSAYEKQLFNFIDSLLEDRRFCHELEEFVQPLIKPGRINSLAQTLIKLTAPGVPDIYQGSELWDLSLVDPDNRRPVDFDFRRELLKKIRACSPEEILDRMEEGAPKLWVTYQGLQLRKRWPQIFKSGNYSFLSVGGAKADQVIGFSRDDQVVTIAPRLVYSLGQGWGETWLDLSPGCWKNILTSDHLKGGQVRISQLLARFPVALLVRE